jgi:hypothetical protein
MRRLRLEPILNAHAYLRVERPPQLWDADADLEAFLPLLGEMIAAALVRNGGVLAQVTLNVSNVVVEPEVADPPLPAGEFVAITIRSAGNWHPETTWHPGSSGEPPLVSVDLQAAAARAGALYGYQRALAEDEGSVTIFIARAETDPAAAETRPALG